MSEWRETTLGEVIHFQRGFDLTEKTSKPGPYPVISSGGVSYFTTTPKVDGPGVVTGRKGVLGKVHFSQGPYWPHDTTLWITDFKGNNPRFVYYWLQTLPLASLDGGAANPTLNRNHVHLMPVRVPDPSSQLRISEILSSLDDLIENNQRRIVLLEQMARAIYREWFVYFRYPGYEDDELVDSSLGPIPSGWAIRPLAELAANQKHAITGGPFGSKLGRKDYVEDGVPVIRGANLKIGGGFDTTAVAFVLEEKADELKSSLARPGDIVVTQRGTLGQVGLIPLSSRWPRYVLSQSQMKITVDRTLCTPEFIYSQLRSADTTGRFVAQAITSGVPHVNLALLREFNVLAPPIEIVQRFSDSIGALEDARTAIAASSAVLAQQRDLLLPKLVAGVIDVSQLNLDELFDQTAA